MNNQSPLASQLKFYKDREVIIHQVFPDFKIAIISYANEPMRFSIDFGALTDAPEGHKTISIWEYI